MIRELAAAGMTMVVATHEMAFARTSRTVSLSSRRAGSWRKGAPEDMFTEPREAPRGSSIGSSPPVGCNPACRRPGPRLACRAPVPHRVRVRARRRPARCDRPADRRRPAGEEHITLLGATGTGKTFTIAHVIERVQRPTLVMAPNKSLAAQLANEFRELLPRQRRRVLRQLLRLLPTRGVRPADRHVHREGQLGERGDRAAAALGDRGAAQPQRRDHRRERLGDLRPGVARGVRGAAPARLSRHRGADGVRDAAAGRHPVQAQPGQPRPWHVPRDGGHARGLPAVRAGRLPDRVVGRRGAEDQHVRPADRRDRRRTTSSTTRRSRRRTTSRPTTG